MKPILTALAGVAIAVSVAASGFAQGQDNEPDHPPNAQPEPNSLGADWGLQQNEVRQGVTQRRLVPLATVIQQLSQRMGGRQLDAGLEYQGDRPIYRVRWITRDGRRVDVLIDAVTGAVLGGG